MRGCLWEGGKETAREISLLSPWDFAPSTDTFLLFHNLITAPTASFPSAQTGNHCNLLPYHSHQPRTFLPVFSRFQPSGHFSVITSPDSQNLPLVPAASLCFLLLFSTSCCFSLNTLSSPLAHFSSIAL